MLDVYIDKKPLLISNVEKNELLEVQGLLEKNKEKVEYSDLKERFFEFLISEGEIFLKITIKSELIGVARGRIEFYETSKLWISFFMIDNDIVKGLEKNIFEEIIAYFINKYAVKEIEVGITKADDSLNSSLLSIGFTPSRITKNYFTDEKNSDLIVMKKII